MTITEARAEQNRCAVNLAAAIKQGASTVLLYQFAVDLENATQRLLRTSMVQTSAVQQ